MEKFIDWHPADIIAGLRKKGTSLAAESRRNGLSSSTLANALTRPWAKRRADYCSCAGYEAVDYLALTLS
ncbi:DNA-binding transcriptional regulator Nlp [Raoultella planticola]|uniref:DNA-binding transcriptional regulator Nlp n=1 Tax=Raoultella planticola TaxID=575 RepID=A0A485D8G6_RAOPL|nr:DNA-binding transcriptional regulator Nlp [Raoultella planticola]